LLGIPEKFLNNPPMSVNRDDFGGFPDELIGKKIFGGLVGSTL
jgi:hypothetical protein